MLCKTRKSSAQRRFFVVACGGNEFSLSHFAGVVNAPAGAVFGPGALDGTLLALSTIAARAFASCFPRLVFSPMEVVGKLV